MRRGRRSPLKSVTSRRFPFSMIVESWPLSPRTGSPALSRTATGTRTVRVPDAKIGPAMAVPGVEGVLGAGGGGLAAFSAGATRRRADDQRLGGPRLPQRRLAGLVERLAEAAALHLEQDRVLADVRLEEADDVRRGQRLVAARPRGHGRPQQDGRDPSEAHTMTRSSVLRGDTRMVAFEDTRHAVLGHRRRVCHVPRAGSMIRAAVVKKIKPASGAAELLEFPARVLDLDGQIRGGQGEELLQALRRVRSPAQLLLDRRPVELRQRVARVEG